MKGTRRSKREWEQVMTSISNCVKWSQISSNAVIWFRSDGALVIRYLDWDVVEHQPQQRVTVNAPEGIERRLLARIVEKYVPGARLAYNRRRGRLYLAYGGNHVPFKEQITFEYGSNWYRADT